MAIAHRGCSAIAPENTIVAFDEAIRLGCQAVELDVRLSADGVPVVIHDDTVDRTTNGNGGVSGLSKVELLRLDAGSGKHHRYAGSRIPTLDEALAAIAPWAVPVIELKEHMNPALLASLLRRHDALDSCVLISQEESIVASVRKIGRDVQTGLIADEWTDDLPERCQKLDAPLLILNVESIALERIQAVDQAGLELWCYTVNDIGLVAACAAMGVSGLITDDPGLVRRKS
jgi:glycerophosphoryl diester phosphodiesterase